MKDITHALSIMAQINGLSGARASDLTPVPVDGLSPQAAIRVLQVQIFTLSDALSDLAEAVAELQQLQNRRR